MKEVRDILANARTLIEHPDHWSRRANARDANDRECEYESGRAVKFCVYGAVMRATLDPNAMQFYAQCVGALRRICPDRAIFTFNDDVSTTHADVLALFDAAIVGEREHEEACRA